MISLPFTIRLRLNSTVPTCTNFQDSGGVIARSLLSRKFCSLFAFMRAGGVIHYATDTLRSVCGLTGQPVGINSSSPPLGEEKSQFHD